MNSKYKFLLFYFVCIGAFIFLATSCKDDEPETTEPVLGLITTSYICDLELNSASCYGTINNINNDSIAQKGVCWSGVNSSPTLSDSVVVAGGGSASYKAVIPRLDKNSTYYARAFVTDTSNVTTYGDVLSFTTLDTISDIDHNVYRTIKIGGQVWMVDNLRTTRYNNGDTIPFYADEGSWANADTGSYGYYSNKTLNIPKYGLLYNWHAISDSRKLAPVGWHIPSDAEWETLINNLGGYMIAGGKLKGSATKISWTTPNIGATNESSFDALPAGIRNYTGTYSGLGTSCGFWTSTEFDNGKGWSRSLGNGYKSVTRLVFYKRVGFSVRCIKD